MEAHPVPKNINSFEFHLVGDMTIKQFLYVASGLGSAYLLFIFFGTTAPLVAWPLIVISVILGLAYAFLPFAERPLDHWTAAFFRAIFRPTQYAFHSSAIAEDNPAFGNRVALYLQAVQVLSNQHQIKPNTPQQKATIFGQQASPVQQPPPKPVTNQPKVPSSDELKKSVELAKIAQEVQQEIKVTEQEMAKIKAGAATPGAKPEEFATSFKQTLTDLQKLNEEASSVSKQLAILSKTPSIPKRKVRAEEQTEHKNLANITLTAIPNVINGIVADARGNYLEGAIVIAHDKQGLPVRALKSNKLGQFVAATPLQSGPYTLTVEKDDLNFDVIEIELKDEVLKPIVVSAKRVEPTI